MIFIKTIYPISFPLPFTENEKYNLGELFQYYLKRFDSAYVEGMEEIVRFLESSCDLLYRLVDMDRFRQASYMLEEFIREIEEPKRKLH